MQIACTVLEAQRLACDPQHSLHRLTRAAVRVLLDTDLVIEEQGVARRCRALIRLVVDEFVFARASGCVR